VANCNYGNSGWWFCLRSHDVDFASSVRAAIFDIDHHDCFCEVASIVKRRTIADSYRCNDTHGLDPEIAYSNEFISNWNMFLATMHSIHRPCCTDTHIKGKCRLDSENTLTEAFACWFLCYAGIRNSVSQFVVWLLSPVFASPVFACGIRFRIRLQKLAKSRNDDVASKFSFFNVIIINSVIKKFSIK